MNRRSFMKALGLSPIAAKPAIQEIGNKLAVHGLPVGRGGSYDNLRMVEPDSIPEGPSTASSGDRYSLRLRRAVEWFKKKGVPDHIKSDVYREFDRNPAIPVHIATRRATSPAVKLHLAKQEYFEEQVRHFLDQEERDARRNKLPDYLKEIWL